MQITITPQDIEKYEEFEEGVQDYPLYGHTDGLTKVEIVLLAKLLEYEFPNDLAKPLKVTIN
jgi:hypothetical protein